MLREILAHVLREEHPHSGHDVSSIIRERVRQLIEVSHTDPTFNVQTIISHLNISRRHLYRHFEDSPLGVSELIADRRLETAMEIMSSQPLLTLGKVSSSAGFGSTENLRRAFLRQHGTTPSDYRKQLSVAT